MQKKDNSVKKTDTKSIKRAAVQTELFLKLPADKQKQVIDSAKALLSGK